MRLHFAIALGLLSSAACGQDDADTAPAGQAPADAGDASDEVAAEGDGDGPEGAPTPPTYLADPSPASGPRLALEAAWTGTRVALRVSAHGLGQVFGLSYHLESEEALALVGEPAQPPFLGADADALQLVALGPGDVALGGTRRAPSLGAVAIADGATLATLSYEARPGSTSRVAIATAYARAADGRLIPIHGDAGTLTLPASAAPPRGEVTP